MEPRQRDGQGDAGPSRRSLLIGAIVVLALVLVGLFVAQGLLDMSRLQDCAATGRRDC